MLLALSSWLEAIGLVDWARGSASVYPWANVLHVMGVVMVVGGIGVVDLRIMGFWRQLPLAPLSDALTPIAIVGVVVQISSGLVLFAADGEALSASNTFHVKLILLLLVLANAVAFRLHWRRTVMDRHYRPSPAVRVSALFSLTLWLAIATAGRLIAYY